MKKILLGTTALIGAATLLAGAANAEDPKVTVGGFSTFEAGYVKSDYDSGERSVSFRNDNEIHFNIAGKTDAGLGYGAEIDLEADINGSSAATNGSTNQGISAHRTYGWLQGDQWGHFEFGSNDGAARTLKVDASNIARATGGIDGDWNTFADVNVAATSTTTGGSVGTFAGTTPAGVAAPRSFITAPRLPVENGPATTFYSDTWGNDDKVTYYTPRFQGFQLGVSFAPSLADRGQTDTRYADLGFDASNIYSGGLNYETQYEGVGIAAAATGEAGKADASTGNNLEAWNAGLKLSYLGFSAAGSYGDWENSFAVSGTKADYWTAGLAYETGPLGASVTYLNSEDKPTGQDNKFQDISVGVDYKLAPGLTPFVEYTYYDINPSGGTAASGNVSSNKGDVVIIGSQLSF